MKSLLVLLMLPVFAYADALNTDFEALFENNKDKITAVDQGKHLSLPNEVSVTRTASGYVGVDRSVHGAVGCSLAITLDVIALAQLKSSLCLDRLPVTNPCL